MHRIKRVLAITAIVLVLIVGGCSDDAGTSDTQEESQSQSDHGHEHDEDSSGDH